MITFTTGIIQSCFELLEMTQKRSLPFDQIAVAFNKLGRIPISTVIGTAGNIGWLTADEDGTALPTASGFRLLGLDGYELRLRQALLDYVDTTDPSWVQNVPAGRSRALSSVDKGVYQALFEAGLTISTDLKVVEFWDTLAAKARGQKIIRNVEVGRKGEQLTIIHEMKRTNSTPKWKAVESNWDGYDVRSIVRKNSNDPLLIEVKATKIGRRTRFHLTANEWRSAGNSKNYVFHIWDISQFPLHLAVLDKSDIEPHIPENRGSGMWESVEIELSRFSQKFSPQKGIALPS